MKTNKSKTNKVTKTARSLPGLSSEQLKLYLVQQLEKALRSKYRPKPTSKPKAKARPKRKRRPVRKPVGAALVAATEPGAGPLPASQTIEDDSKNRSTQQYLQDEFKRAQAEHAIHQLTRLRRARDALFEEPRPSAERSLPAPEERKRLPAPDAVGALPAPVDLPRLEGPSQPRRMTSITDPYVAARTALPPSPPSSPRVKKEEVKDEFDIPDSKRQKTTRKRRTAEEQTIRSGLNAVVESAISNVKKNYEEKKLNHQALVDDMLEVIANKGTSLDMVNDILKNHSKYHRDITSWEEFGNLRGYPIEALRDILLRVPDSRLNRTMKNDFMSDYLQILETAGFGEEEANAMAEEAYKRLLAERVRHYGAGRSGTKKPDEMLSNLDIDRLMRKTPEYAGTFARDNFVAVKLSKVGPTCWIMNTDPAGQPGQHWVAVFIDPNGSRTVEYYDPFGEPCPEDVYVDIARMVPLASPDYMLKFKENLAVNQAETTNNCGYFCIKFLLHRIDGKPWKFASGYTDLREAEIERFKKRHPMFKGFIKYM